MRIAAVSGYLLVSFAAISCGNVTTTTDPAELQVESKTSKSRNNLVRSPFHGLMSTATGLLAAVGGGYLMYAAMVTLFENYLDPAFDRAVLQPGPYGPAPPVRRTEHSSGAPWTQFLQRIVRALKGYDYPEATFRYLQVEGDGCRQRAVCELQQVLRKSGLPKSVLTNLSVKIPGMEKYRDAIWWGSQKESCKGLYGVCPHGLGTTLLRAFGFS